MTYPISPQPVPPGQLPPFSPSPSTTATGGSVTDTTKGDLGLLAGLIGKWSGKGLNAIWTPSQGAVTGSDHFLQLAGTDDSIEFVDLGGKIPNRGLLQPDLEMSGLRYAQNISSGAAALHFEDGIWLSVPPTTQPALGATVVRMASIPHGTTINAQGTASEQAGPPTIPPVSITPFLSGQPAQLQHFLEETLASPTNFRSKDAVAQGFDQATLTDVNTRLRSDAKSNVTKTVTITVTTELGGVLGASNNTAFLVPNATTTAVRSTIWLQTLAGETAPSQLQYSQTVLLDFAGFSWPHVTVGTLQRQPG